MNGNGMAGIQRFRYRAAAADGRITRGVLVASGLENARARLFDLQLMPLQLQADAPFAFGRSRISDADLALGARILSDLIGSGLSIGKALQSFDDLTPRSWQRHVPRLREEVRAGAPLSIALASLDDAVPGIFTGLVRAGEMGTGLAAALDSAATLFESKAASRAALVSALTYPAFLLVVCLGSISMLGGVVLPRFAVLLNDLGQKLPPSTAALLAASAALRASAPVGIPAFAFVIIGFWLWTMTASGRPAWHAFLLRLPLVGGARAAWASATVCATTGSLVGSGVIVSTALQHASAACGDAAVANRVMAARQAVLAGTRPSHALEQQRALTTVAVRLLRAGEESGRVSAMLLRAAELERARATRTLRTTIRLIEPTLVVGLGALVAFIAMALLQAVYAMRPGQ